MTKETILKTLKTLKPQYEQEGLSIVGLFGSFAKDQDDKFSDIDIVYHIDYPRFSEKFQDGFSKILRLQDIKSELESLFHKKVDLISLNSNNHLFTNKVNKEMIRV